MILITYKTHNNGGLFLGLVLLLFPLQNIFEYFNTVTLSIMFIIYMYSLYLGSLFPDIDHTGSYIGRRLPIISNIVKSKFGHRGFMHSLLLIYYLIISSFLINIIFKVVNSHFYYIISIYIYTLECGFILGCISHICLDMLNSDGVCLLYPDTKRYRINLVPSIKLNSKSEKFISNILSSLNSIMLMYYLYIFLKFNIVV